jgi:SAM-dependent methyltransferase
MANFYDKHAEEFFASTIGLDMSPLYREFLQYVPAGGLILDAGCGSGRDAKIFKDWGYEVTAMDASQALCELASAHIGQRVHCLQFNEIAWQKRFDAIWACASLLHLTEDHLADAFQRLIASLQTGGVLYCSFKWGDSERNKDGRHFLDLTENRFRSLVIEKFEVDVIKIWKSADRRAERNEEHWLNALIKSR